ncbi:MAG: FliG C-terminal domain-containing protein, partial [Deltaproteobacteria bacterium]
ARLEPSAAAAILVELPQDRQRAIVQHVGRMTEVPANLLEDVASALVGELPTSDSSTLVTVDGVARAAAMLNAAGTRSSQILQDLDETDAELATDVRQAMFTFDDLKRLDAKGMRDLLREVPTDRLTLALKEASPEMVAAVFRGLSARAAELIRDDLELLGRQRKSDIDAARREIIEVALRLEGEGRVDLGRGGGE